MTNVPQSFMDALCNVLAKHDNTYMDRRRHDKMRGFEGSNGTACRRCEQLAEAIWTEDLRIREQHRRR